MSINTFFEIFDLIKLYINHNEHNSLTYDEYNINSGLELTYEPPQKPKLKRLWESLWNRLWGKVIAVALAVIALVVTGYVASCMFYGYIFALASVVVTLTVGGLISGIQSQKRGK